MTNGIKSGFKIITHLICLKPAGLLHPDGDVLEVVSKPHLRLPPVAGLRFLDRLALDAYINVLIIDM
jgi:hypothetical protein